MDKFIAVEKKQLHPHYLIPTTIKSRFTLRITQKKKNPYSSEDYITFFKIYKKLIKVMIFEELADHLHYHIYVLSNVSLDAVRKRFKKNLPSLHQNKNGNNDMFAFHDCGPDKNKDYAPNYVAKDGVLIYNKAFSTKQIATFVHAGSVYKTNQKYKESKNLHNYIATKYITDPNPQLDYIFTNIIKYYEDKKKVLPPSHIFNNLLHKVSYVSSQKYRINYVAYLKNHVSLENKFHCMYN